MFRLHKTRPTKSKERIDFEFSHFKALQVFILNSLDVVILTILFSLLKQKNGEWRYFFVYFDT